MIPKYTKVIKAIIYFYKKYQEEAIEILIHNTVNINQKLGPFYISKDPTLHKWAKYLTNKIGKRDPNNQKVLQDFFEKYGGEEKNNNDDSIDLKDIL